MAAKPDRHLSLASDNRIHRLVDFTCHIQEGDELVIARLSSMLGKSPSDLITEAIRGLIRKYSTRRVPLRVVRR